MSIRNEVMVERNKRFELERTIINKLEELEKKLIDEMDLTEVQKAQLKFIFSIEHARFAGVPEDKLLVVKREVK